MKGKDEEQAKESAAIASILGGLANPHGDLDSRKRGIMQRLAIEISADGWLWVVIASRFRSPHFSQGHRSGLVATLHHGLSNEQFSGWLQANRGDEPVLTEFAILTERVLGKTHCTARRSDLVSDRHWYNHPTVQKCYIERGIDDQIYSVRPFPQGDYCSVVSVCRSTARAGFSARDARVMHTVLSSIAWMHKATPSTVPKNISHKLTPTQRIVFSYLLEGRRRSEIACQMQISEETARDHIRVVLRLYGVRDQLELVCQFQADRRD